MQQAKQNTNALELDHLIGYTGKFPNVHFLPNQPNYFIYSIGSQVVIENVNDKHEQIFLRGHDAYVSCIAVSNSGRLIASGQQGSQQTKQGEAPIILWDSQKKQVINIFKGLKEQIKILSFSPDERFLAASSANNALIIWNTQDLSIVYSKVLEVETTLFEWSPVINTKNIIYQFVTAQGQQILLNNMEYNPTNKQFAIKQAIFNLPSTGLVRIYTKANINQSGEYLYAGTTTGEVCIFQISSKIFKAAIPISNNGVQSLLLQDNNLFVGSGDGRLKKLTGVETRWQLESEIQLELGISTISLSPDKQELIIGSASSKIYRVLIANLETALNTEGHMGAIIGLAFQKGNNNIFATIDDQGYIYVWDNNTLSVITKCTSGTMQRQKGTALAISDDGQIIGGFEDGFVRCFNIATNKKFSPLSWEINNAHKGAITSVYADNLYILTGGKDGIVRIWSKNNRQLITQIQQHTKDVVSVFPDLKSPNLIHSASHDKLVLTYDLKLDKKVILRQAKNGTLLQMTQLQNNQDLITCGQNMPIFLWQLNKDQPYSQIALEQKIVCIEASPTGNFLSLGSEQGEVLVMEVKSQKIIGNFQGHSTAVSRVKWTSDEKQIISTSFDSSICIWNFFPN